jgi:hypothetical protein
VGVRDGWCTKKRAGAHVLRPAVIKQQFLN